MALERVKARPRTVDEIADEDKAREIYRDRPSIRTLIDRGEIDPESVTTGIVEQALIRILGALKRARQATNLSLSEVSRRSGIDVASLSRLESGKNPNPTFETLSRYAQALSLRLELSLVKAEESAAVGP